MTYSKIRRAFWVIKWIAPVAIMTAIACDPAHPPKAYQIIRLAVAAFLCGAGLVGEFKR